MIIQPMGLWNGASAPPSWWLSGGIASGDCAAAFAGKAAASYAASLVNLNSPGTGDAFTAAAPTWDAVNGWTFDGSSQYLDTSVLLATGMSMIVKYAESATTIGRTVVGIYNGASGRSEVSNRLFNGSDAVQYYAAGFSVANTPSPVLSAGSLGFAGSTCYRNGLPDGTVSGATTATSSTGRAIGARKREDLGPTSIDAFFPGSISSVAFYGAILSDAQMLAVFTDMP